MPKPELGTKRVCVSCGTKFFDMMKQPAVCPKCGTEQPAEQPRLKRAPGIPDDKRRLKPTPAPGVEDADVDVEVADDEEGEEDVLEDTSDLEDGAEGIDVDVETEGGEEER